MRGLICTALIEVAAQRSISRSINVFLGMKATNAAPLGSPPFLAHVLGVAR